MGYTTREQSNQGVVGVRSNSGAVCMSESGGAV